MMRFAGPLCAAITTLLLSGCGVFGGGDAPDDRSGIDPRAFIPINADTEAPDLATLKEYSVPSGRCGMILFTRAGDRTVPIMRLLADGEARLEIENQPTLLRLTERGGESRVGLSSRARLEGIAADGQILTAEISTVWGKSFPAGAYVEAGTLTLAGADGWTRVVPVAGIAGCRA